MDIYIFKKVSKHFVQQRLIITIILITFYYSNDLILEINPVDSNTVPLTLKNNYYKKRMNLIL